MIRNLLNVLKKTSMISWDNEENIEDGISIMHPNENMEEALLDSFDRLTK